MGIYNNMARRKIGNSHTTISITWSDKDELRKLAQLIKKTKSGDMYESDAMIFKRVLDYYNSNHPVTSAQPHQTYPTRTFPTHAQQG